MIVRIMGEGQLDVADAQLDALNRYDDELRVAIDGGDDAAFRAALAALLAKVREVGTAVPAEEIVPSDLMLPAADAHVDEVRKMLGADGLVPGRYSPG
jgi:PspAA-like protein